MNKSKQLLENKWLIDIGVFIPDIIVDLKYATNDNFTWKIHYSENSCFLLKDVAHQLKKVQKELSDEWFSLKIWDAYRPNSVQLSFHKYCSDTSFVADVSNHSRGITVDLTIVDKNTKIDIEMPTGFDDFSEYAHAKCRSISKEKIANRERLINIMMKYGFTVYENEWWHFDYLSLVDSEVLDISL